MTNLFEQAMSHLAATPKSAGGALTEDEKQRFLAWWEGYPKLTMNEALPQWRRSESK